MKESITPKYTADWYLKWIASALILSALSLRGLDGWQLYDLILSITGCFLWLLVSLLWKDRALVMLNGVGLIFLFRNLWELLG